MAVCVCVWCVWCVCGVCVWCVWCGVCVCVCACEGLIPITLQLTLCVWFIKVTHFHSCQLREGVTVIHQQVTALPAPPSLTSLFSGSFLSPPLILGEIFCFTPLVRKQKNGRVFNFKRDQIQSNCFFCDQIHLFLYNHRYGSSSPRLVPPSPPFFLLLLKTV